jgi:enamine deaminase RidA (YjgF/YER057c/UK114 family)
MANGFNPRDTWGPRQRGFSIGIVQHAGHVIHFTGQVAWNETEEIVGLGDVRTQTHQCFRNIATILSAVGGVMDDIVSLTTYFMDRSHLPIIQAVRNGYFEARAAPASTSVIVTGLGHADFLVEVTPVAVVPDERFKQPVG